MLCRHTQTHAMGMPCLCVSVCVCLSVTSRSSTKTAKRRITQTTPHDSPGSLVFCIKDLRKIRPGSPPTGAPNAGGVGQYRRLSTNNRLNLDKKLSYRRVTARYVLSVVILQITSTRNSAETTYTTSLDQTDGMKLEV